MNKTETMKDEWKNIDKNITHTHTQDTNSHRHTNGITFKEIYALGVKKKQREWEKAKRTYHKAQTSPAYLYNLL